MSFDVNSYAQEAVLILLGPDGRIKVEATTSIHYQKVSNAKEQLSKFVHIIASLSHKAKRVSGSTSRAETLAGVVGKELAQMIAMRLTELFAPGISLPMKQPATMAMLIQIQDNAEFFVPIDHWTDCRDFFELSVGLKGVPQDRHQRLYVLSVREDRLRGFIRRFFWCPTTAMLCDGLTKSMTSEILYDLLTYGFWRFDDRNLGALVATRDAPAVSVTEHDLISMKPAWAESPSVCFVGLSTMD